MSLIWVCILKAITSQNLIDFVEYRRWTNFYFEYVFAVYTRPWDHFQWINSELDITS